MDTTYGYYAVDRDTISVARGTYENNIFVEDGDGEALQLEFDIKLIDGAHRSGSPTIYVDIYRRRDTRSTPLPDAHEAGGGMDITDDGATITAKKVFPSVVKDEALYRIDVVVRGYQITDIAAYPITDSLSIPFSAIPPLIRGDVTGTALGFGIPASEELDPETISVRDRFFITTSMNQYAKLIQQVYDTFWPVGTVLQHVCANYNEAKAYAATLQRNVSRYKLYGGSLISILRATWTADDSPTYSFIDAAGTRQCAFNITRTK